ncbi:hypothetical protein HAX54_008851, partial [Datura stramonium]|nr:hypothetical protein [Datura stramonium]
MFGDPTGESPLSMRELPTRRRFQPVYLGVKILSMSHLSDDFLNGKSSFWVANDHVWESEVQQEEEHWCWKKFGSTKLVVAHRRKADHDQLIAGGHVGSIARLQATATNPHSIGASRFEEASIIARDQPQWATSKGMIYRHDLKFEARMWLDL